MNWRMIVAGGMISTALLFSPTHTHAKEVTVKKGDTLYLIAQRNGTTIEAIKGINRLSGNTIYPGQIIRTTPPLATYTVVSGDSLYVISQKFKTTIETIKQINHLQSNEIYPGQRLKIPSWVKHWTYEVQPGDFLWKIGQFFGADVEEIKRLNRLTGDELYPGQRLNIPIHNGKTPTAPVHTKTWVEYKTYTVQAGDTPWTIALKFGIPYTEFLEINDMSESDVLRPGDRVTIAVHHVPVKATNGPQYGEKLDWWTEAQYVWPIGTDAVIVDFYTGKRWNMRRTIGASHADVEPLTAKDTEIMKQVWGGQWSWSRRPVLVLVNGHRIAASASAMPHSVQYIQNNGFPGHSDIHFWNSRRHKDNQIDAKHQANIRIATGE